MTISTTKEESTNTPKIFYKELDAKHANDPLTLLFVKTHLYRVSRGGYHEGSQDGSHTRNGLKKTFFVYKKSPYEFESYEICEANSILIQNLKNSDFAFKVIFSNEKAFQSKH